MKRAWHWICRRFRDLFYSVGNEHLDLARCIAGACAGLAAFALLWNAVKLGKEIDLSGFLTGLAALVTSLGALVALKDYARTKSKGPDQ